MADYAKILTYIIAGIIILLLLGAFLLGCGVSTGAANLSTSSANILAFQLGSIYNDYAAIFKSLSGSGPGPSPTDDGGDTPQPTTSGGNSVTDAGVCPSGVPLSVDLIDSF